MEVTQKNFSSLFPQIVADITRSKFISFDQELSGIYKDALTQSRKFETIEEWYLRNRRFTAGFVILQFRITCFFVSPGKEQQYRSYLFFVNSCRPNFQFQSTTDAMSYLAENGFDFVKLFRDGIPYSNQLEEKELMTELAKMQEKRDLPFVREKHKEVEVPSKYLPKIIKLTADISEFVSDDSLMEKMLGPFNSHFKLFVYQVLETKYLQTIIPVTEGVGTGMIKLVKVQGSAEQMQLKIDEKLGMRRVFLALVKAKKLLVGHNIFVHLMYIVRQFFVPLPADYQEYKRIVHDLFPNLIDTKHFCEDNSIVKQLLKKSVIKKMVQDVHRAPFKLPLFSAFGREYGHRIDLTNLEMSSGAFRIGMCFIAMAGAIGVPPKEINAANPAFHSILNKLFVQLLPNANSLQIGFASSDGPDLNQDRSNVFFVTFPNNFDRWTFQEVFQDFGKIRIIFLSITTGLLELNLETVKARGRDPRTVDSRIELQPYDEYVREKWGLLKEE